MMRRVFHPRLSAAGLAAILALAALPLVVTAQASTGTVSGRIAWCKNLPLPTSFPDGGRKLPSAMTAAPAAPAAELEAMAADAGIATIGPDGDVPLPGGARGLALSVVPASALVSVTGTVLSTRTDEQGRFRLADAPAGSMVSIRAASVSAPEIILQTDVSIAPNESVELGTLFLGSSGADCQASVATPSPQSSDTSTTTRTIQQEGTTGLTSTPSMPSVQSADEGLLPGTNAAPAPLGGSATGITGSVVIGPTCPVQRAGDNACADRPFATTVLVLTATDSREVGRVDTDANGAFSVALDPGKYIVEILRTASLYPRGNPVPVTVGASGLTPVRIALDSGIR